MAKKTPEQKAAEAKAKADKKAADAKAKAGKSASDVNFGGAGPAPEPTKADKKTKFPEVEATGKFHSVAFGGGHVVYNEKGQRATGVTSEAIAKDLVTKNNIAGGLK